MDLFSNYTFFVALFLLSCVRNNGARMTRDTTGHYHGEHHHQEVLTTTDSKGVFPPNCLCVVKGTGCIGREDYTRQFDGISTLTCGHAYERCCFEDPWPGIVDNYAGVAPCVPQEECPRYYGQLATDVRDFGVLGPCPGLGTVRCLDGPAPEPPIVVPIVPLVLPPAPETPPSVVYEVPVAPTEPPPPPPPTIPPHYDLPAPPPQTYGPPEAPPPVVYEAPPATYEAPPATYEAPAKVAVVAPERSPAFSRPGPPYIWQNLHSAAPYSYGYGWPGFGFRFSKRLGLGYGIYG